MTRTGPIETVSANPPEGELGGFSETSSETDELALEECQWRVKKHSIACSVLIL